MNSLQKWLFVALCVFFLGCSPQAKQVDSPRQVDGLYNQSHPELVKIAGSKAQLSEERHYSYAYDDIYNATILALSFNKYNILIDNYQNGFLSGRNKYCTYAIYLEGNDEGSKVKMTIIYDIFTDFENKLDLMRKDIENQFLTVYRFL